MSTIPDDGAQVIINFDGVAYESFVQSYLFLGDVYNAARFVTNDGRAYAVVLESVGFVVSEDGIVGETHKFEVFTIDGDFGTVVHKLDSKYLDLPKNVATTDDVQMAIDVANTAQTTANTAVANADTAQATADTKMDAVNPIGTGSFSMNRQPESDIGDYSVAIGQNTIAQHAVQHVIGQYNDAATNYIVYYFKNVNAAILNSTYYYSQEYKFDKIKGIVTLVNPQVGVISEIPGGYYFAATETINSSKYFYWRNVASSMNQYQYRIKKCSIADKGAYAHVVGNGTSDDTRSNAHTLDWEGNAWYSGDVYVGSTSGTNKDEGSKKLATEEYVNEALSGFEVNGVSYVAQDTAPEDLDVLWVDTADNTEVEIGANDLVVGIEYVNKEYSLIDITYDEIVAAIDEGKNIRAEWVDSNNIRKVYPLIVDRSKYSSSPYLVFSYNNQINTEGFAVQPTNKVERWGTTLVPNTRKINNKPLSADITLTAADVGAIATVNGMAPDENGNVDVAGGSGCDVSVEGEKLFLSDGSEVKWEQIEYFTLDEEVSKITRSKYLDGSDYNLDAIKVIIKIPYPIYSIIGTGINVYSNNKKIGNLVTATNTDSRTNEGYYFSTLYKVVPVYGLYDFIAAKGQQGGEMNISYSANGNYQQVSTDSKINLIELVAWQNVFLIGTTIEIWGVRAHDKRIKSNVYKWR